MSRTLHRYYCPECHYDTLNYADYDITECPECGAEMEYEEIDFDEMDLADLD